VSGRKRDEEGEDRGREKKTRLTKPGRVRRTTARHPIPCTRREGVYVNQETSSVRSLPGERGARKVSQLTKTARIPPDALRPLI